LSDEADRFSAASEQFEAALAARNHPLGRFLRPGLSVERIESLMATTHRGTPPAGASGPPLRLPEAAARLWSWHDGVDTTDLTRVPGSEQLPGGLVFLPLELAVQNYQASVADFPWTDLDDMSPDWFPIATMGHGDQLLVDCAGTAQGQLVYRKLGDYNTQEDFERENLPSIAHAFEAWTRLLVSGDWALDGGTWTYTREWQPELPSWY